MTVCAECGKPTVPFKFRIGSVDPTPISICRVCRGKRSAAAVRRKRDIHGSDFFNGRNADARRKAI